MNSNILQKAKKLFEEGIELIKNENFSLAEEKFIKCLDLFPERLSVLHNLISIYIKKNKKEKLSKILENHKNLVK